MSKYILEITPSGCYVPLEKYGEPTTNTKLLFDDPDSVRAVVFTGGHDVNPQYYNEPCGRFTSFSDERDRYEISMFKEALKHKKPCVGFCRGSQFLCVMSGGRLAQDITGHLGYHTIRTHTGKSIPVNSTHHQMQVPGKDARILAVADPKRSKHYLDGTDTHFDCETENEAVYYPNINALGIQWHPEWLKSDHPAFIYTQELIEEFLIPQ